MLADTEARAAALSDVQSLAIAPAWIAAHTGAVAAEHAIMMRHNPVLLVQALDAAVLARGDIRDLFASISAPVAVLSGKLDQATPPALGDEIAAGVVDGQHHLVPDTAHHLPTEAPGIVTHAITTVRQSAVNE